MSKIYVKVRDAWHVGEEGHALPVTGRRAIKLACTGALVARMVPESVATPAGLCRACVERPGVERPDVVAKVRAARGATRMP